MPLPMATWKTAVLAGAITAAGVVLLDSFEQRFPGIDSVFVTQKLVGRR